MVYAPSSPIHEVLDPVYSLATRMSYFTGNATNTLMAAGDPEGAMALVEEVLDLWETHVSPRKLGLHSPGVAHAAVLCGRTDLIDRVLGWCDDTIDAIRSRRWPTDLHHPGLDQLTSQREWVKDAREGVAHLEGILAAVKGQPGVKQADLRTLITGLTTRVATSWVADLEAIGTVKTTKIGSRVHVWPADHPEPEGESRPRQFSVFYGPDADLSEYVGTSYWHAMSDPVRTCRQLASLLRTIAEAKADERQTRNGLKPTPLDFLDIYNKPSHDAYLGYPVLSQIEDPSVAVWGHIDLDEFRQIVPLIVGDERASMENVDPVYTPYLRESLRRLLAAAPRHTHVTRFPAGEGWVLAEVPEPTADSVPATVVAHPLPSRPRGWAYGPMARWL
ncbi:hypothetical protein [Arthrobacter rhombi]|uniref:hypothetical protein n=1 Tax=Arthrobacter rhombi TaxID=71253 RepID=UPI003FD2B5DA